MQSKAHRLSLWNVSTYKVAPNENTQYYSATGCDRWINKGKGEMRKERQKDTVRTGERWLSKDGGHGEDGSEER